MNRGSYKTIMILFWIVYLLMRVPPVIGWVDANQNLWVLGIPFVFAWFWGWSFVGIVVTLVYFYSIKAGDFDDRMEKGV